MNAVLSLVPQTRICKTCNEPKSIADFQVHGGYALHKCKPCHRAYKREQHAKYMQNPFKKEKLAEKRKNWQTANPDKRRTKDRPDRLKKKYGIESWQAVISAHQSQHGLCANRACGKEISLEGPMGRNRAVIDHDHKTGKFRALLCARCNLVLGTLEEQKNVVLGLMEYATKHSSKE